MPGKPSGVPFGCFRPDLIRALSKSKYTKKHKYVNMNPTNMLIFKKFVQNTRKPTGGKNAS